MSGKNLTFKLIMDADSKSFVANVKQSEQTAKSVFETIRTEADRVRQESEKASKELENIVPKNSIETANKLKQTLEAATEIIQDAGDDAKQTADNFSDFGNKAEKALNTVQTDLTEAQQKLKNFSNTSAKPADIEKAKTEVDALEKEVGQADQAFVEFQQEVGRANSKLNESQGATQKFSTGVNNAKFAVNALAGAMAALGVGLGLRELAEAADSYTNLSARINIATREGGDFQGAMSGIHQVALMTNSSLDATGNLFTRLNTVGKEMGMTQQQALDLTKTVTQAIQIGGGSAQASEAAVTQFIQAMQGGVLRGEEFNSIMENGYGLAEALAKGLGVTTGELRKMAENGELSAERVITAVQKQASEVQKTYDQFPTTIGNALQRITTSWEGLIGKMDQSSGASATVAQWLVMLADNIGELDVVLEDIGEGFVWVGDQLKKIDPATIEALKTALESAYATLKTVASTLGESFEITMEILNTSLGFLFDWESGVDSASDKTNGFTKLLQVFNVALGYIGDGFSVIGIVANLLTGVFYDVAAAWQNFKSKFTWGNTKTEIIAEMNAMAEKAREYYNKASNGAMDFKSKGIEAIQEISKTQQQKDAELVASSKAKLDEILNHQQSELDGKKITEAEKLAAVQAYAEAAIDANNGVMDGAMQADLMTKGFVVTLSEAGKVGVEAWSKVEDGAEKTAASSDKARKSATALGVDLDAALSRVSSKFKESEAQVDTFAANISAMGVTGEKAGNAIYQSWVKWLETAKSQTEVDYAKAKLKEFGDQGKLSTSQVEQGMQAVRQVVMKLPGDLDPVEQAFERLGIKTKEQLRLSAQMALSDFETVRQSGQATQEQLQQAYEKTIQLAYASGDAQSIASAKAKAASLGLQVQIDSSGNASVTSMNNLESSIRGVGNAFDGIRGQARSAGETIRGEAQASSKAWESATQAMHKTVTGSRAKMAYDAEAIKAKLVAQGYSDSRASQLANEIYESSKNGNNGYKQVGNNWSFVGGGGGMSNTEYVDQILAKYKGPQTATVQSSSTRKLEITSGAQTSNLYGSESDVDSLESILSQFETIKKSS